MAGVTGISSPSLPPPRLDSGRAGHGPEPRRGAAATAPHAGRRLGPHQQPGGGQPDCRHRLLPGSHHPLRGRADGGHRRRRHRSHRARADPAHRRAGGWPGAGRADPRLHPPRADRAGNRAGDPGDRLLRGPRGPAQPRPQPVVEPTPPPPPPPPPLPPYGPAGYPAYPVYAPPTDNQAIASLVLGIVSFVGLSCCGVPTLILGPLAIYFGRTSAARVQASGGALGGHEIATAGWIIGIIATVLGALYLLFWLAYFGIFAVFGIIIAATVHPSPTPG